MSNPYEDSQKAEDSTRNLHTQNEVFETTNQTGQERPLLIENQNVPQGFGNPSQNTHHNPNIQPQQYQQLPQPQFVQQQGYVPPQVYVQPQPYPQQGQYQNIPPNFQQGAPQQRIPSQGIQQQGIPQQGIPQQGIPQQGIPQQGPPQYQQVPIMGSVMGSVGGGMTCPICFYTGPNVFQIANGTQVWIWVVVLLFFCFFCAWIPLVIDSCKDTKVLCAKCGYCVRTEKEC